MAQKFEMQADVDFDAIMQQRCETVQTYISLIEKAMMLEKKAREEGNLYLTPKEVGQHLHCCEAKARDYMHQPKFPLIETGTKMLVFAPAFHLFNMKLDVMEGLIEYGKQ